MRAPRATYLIKRLELAVRMELDRATNELGLTTPQYAALSSLVVRPGVTSAELARMAFVSAQAMNEMVGTLERKGLIRREPSPYHGKQVRLFLTDDGADRVAQCDRRADAVERRMFSCLSVSERRSFTQLLRACCDALDSQRSLPSAHR